MYKNKLNALLMLVLLSGSLFMTSCGKEIDPAIKKKVTAETTELKKIEKSRGYEAVKKKIQGELEKIFKRDNILDQNLDKAEAEMEKNYGSDYPTLAKACKDLTTELRILKELLDSDAPTEDLAEALVKVKKAKEIVDGEMEKMKGEDKDSL